MRTLFAVVIASCWLTLAAADDTAVATTMAADAYKRLLVAEHWRERSEAASQLEECGEEALPLLIRGTKHDWDKVREACYRSLFELFPDREETADAVVKGLSDDSERIQYRCAFFAGTRKIAAAEPKLREILVDHANDLRVTAAKSLAQLGHADVIRILYREAGSDYYMQRYQASVGLKALSGKDLDDFGDYRWGEGALVSGGEEARLVLRPIADAELRAQRYHTLAEFCRWLKQEHPDLYVHLGPRAEKALRKALKDL